ncbi:radical SAM/SPASM domain-containing protein [Streptomyces sp. NPDC021100]|uniref:radical SAM/SPASM domain-containing protein n=1 Tax=Streptomyces sp. NPDC021100 TaxID=3365114 RepID=UPI0037BB235B
MTTSVQAQPITGVESVECEITAKCDLECAHCCTLSGPRQTHGTMSLTDWTSAVDQIAELHIPMVQFIGGEPTLYPHLPTLVEHALDRRLGVEVYSNLTHVRPSLWSLFEREGVRLATSYYSDDPAQHEQITGGRGSHARTRANLVEALRRDIPLRVGIVEVLDGQRVNEAEAELRTLGVLNIRVDRVRAVGRAAGSTAAPSVDELCGRCYHQRAAISPDGEVYGCILSRNFPTGNVKQDSLATVLTGPRWAEIAERVPDARNACTPDDSNDCDPANTTACAPAFPK